VRLIYFLEGNEPSVAILTKSKYKYIKLQKKTGQIEDQVNSFTALLRSPTTDPTPLSRQLYETLFLPLKEEIPPNTKHISIYSNGVLRTLPFGALNDGHKYLAERFLISYSSYSSSNGFKALQITLSPDDGIAIFGATKFQNGLSDLPNVTSEVGNIYSLATESSHRATENLNARFTKTSLSDALLSNYQVIHIASHFVLRPGPMDESFLALGSDQRLSLRELRANTDSLSHIKLITLSACDTALSFSSSSHREVEGLAGVLGRRGVKSVLASLWPVSDSSTSDFMNSLYFNIISKGKPFVSALKDAQINLITSNSSSTGNSKVALVKSHPFYWAGFILIEGAL
jgi:CHAT domain-containing protein